MSIKQKYIDKSIIALMVVIISSASILSDYNASLIITLFFFMLLSLFKKIRLDNILLIVLVIWGLINLTSAIINPSPFIIDKFLGTTIRIIISYLALKIVGPYLFWLKLEKLIFKLTLVSIPLFFLNSLFPEVFNSLQPIFEPITSKIFYEKESQSLYWYSFFYINNGREDLRNCGFMWEPGAFAMMIVLAIIYNWVSKGIIMNKRLIIYSIALITTFSTAGYLAFSILIIVYTIYSKKTLLIFLTYLILIPSNIYMNNFNFLNQKVDSYIEDFNNNTSYEQNYTDRLEVNRFIYFYTTVIKTFDFPIGYGVLEDKKSFRSPIKIVGVNGLGNTLMMWGWLGLLFVITAVYKFCNRPYHIKLITILLSTSILITFFSNPIENNLILFLVVLTPYIKSKQQYLYD